MSPPTYPLQSWTLGGFRAIRDETRFDLGGLNVLVGSNSAGKSSVLHSILMAAQTLATPLADRPLVLNGALVRLGLAEDCVHEETEGGVTLGFDLIPDEPKLGWRSVAALASVSVHSRFSVSANEEFALERTTMLGYAVEDEVQPQEIALVRRTETEARDSLIKAGLDAERAEDAAAGGSFAVEGDPPERVAGVHARQFLPESVLVIGNAYWNELASFVLMASRRQQQKVAGPRRRPTHGLSEPLIDVLTQFIADEIDEDLAHTLRSTEPLTPELVAAEVPPAVLQQLRDLGRTPWFQDHKDEFPFEGIIETHSLDDLLESGAGFAREWFSRSVRHLGPLRASPQPLYGLPEAASGASVGRNGEYTASVLSAYRDRRVSVPLPDGRIQEMTLGRAVDKWMEELGLLAAVRSEERGKLGFEIHLSVPGVDRDLDLTTVGVGVSQALPIVVLGLIAEPGSLLLFEQPELHLHPDVQAALGDFFLALAESGRQLLVETHSEYLISRLRRRQITDDDLDVAQLVRLFFFEREGSTSRVTPARIADDGSMPDWPRGFLDTAAREIEAMVKRST